jgi:hypothetical protein
LRSIVYGAQPMTTSFTLKVGIFSALVMGSALATGAHAAIFVANTNAASGTLHTPGPSPVDNKSAAAPTTSSSSSLTDRSGDQAAIAASNSVATAEVGAVHAYSTARADAFAPGCCTSALASSSAYAEYNDTFILHSDTIADGTIGQLTANILVNGDAGGDFGGQFWNGTVSWRATTALNGQSFVNGYSSTGDGTNGFTTSGSNTFGMRTLVFDVVFGQAANMFLRVETTASAGAGGFGVNYADFSSDLGHTVSWAGIGGLTVGGLAVTDFTAVSPDTGFDFVSGFGADTAVPEPSTWAMLLMGFAGLGAMARRRLAIG